MSNMFRKATLLAILWPALLSISQQNVEASAVHLGPEPVKLESANTAATEPTPENEDSPAGQAIFVPPGVPSKRGQRNSLSVTCVLATLFVLAISVSVIRRFTKGDENLVSEHVFEIRLKTA